MRPRAALQKQSLRVLLTFVCFGGLPASGIAQVSQTVEQHRDDLGEIDRGGNGFVHRSSGFVFPHRLGPMPARKTTTYGPADAAVNYTAAGGGNQDAWLDLYVYPANGFEAAEDLPNIEDPILGYPEASRTEAPLGVQRGPVGALGGWFRVSMKGKRVVTGYRVVRSGDWFIKARISIPVEGGVEATRRAVEALNAAPWNWKPDPNGVRKSVPAVPVS